MTTLLRTISMLVLFLLLSAGEVSAQGGKWEIYDIGGVKYVSLSDVWRFYRFTPKQGRPGCVSYGAANRVVSVKPERQDFYVNNYRYVLSYPVRKHGEELLISAVDMKKLVDPVLRPRFSKQAGVVKTVVIDPGHGAHDAGAVSPWAREKDCNLAVGLKVKARLEKLGFRVVMTRSTDVFLTLKQRVEIANRTPDSIFVSIHHNSGRRAAEGIETFTLAPQGTTSPFAKTRRFADLAGNDQDSENIALAKACRHYDGLGMDGILLMEGDQVLAVTMGSQMADDTFDIHFEKAREDVDGAYTVVNQEFARYLRLKYPDIAYLDREDDMGLEGLRKAKLSYHPHHMIDKHKAYVAEEIHDL